MIRRYSRCHWSQKINWGLYQSPTLVVWPFMAFLGLEDQPKIDRFLVYFKSLKHSSLDMSAPWPRGLRRRYVGYASSHGFKTRLNRIFGIFFSKWNIVQWFKSYSPSNVVPTTLHTFSPYIATRQSHQYMRWRNSSPKSDNLLIQII